MGANEFKFVKSFDKINTNNTSAVDIVEIVSTFDQPWYHSTVLGSPNSRLKHLRNTRTTKVLFGLNDLFMNFKRSTVTKVSTSR